MLGTRRRQYVDPESSASRRSAKSMRKGSDVSSSEGLGTQESLLVLDSKDSMLDRAENSYSYGLRSRDCADTAPMLCTGNKGSTKEEWPGNHTKQSGSDFCFGSDVHGPMLSDTSKTDSSKSAMT